MVINELLEFLKKKIELKNNWIEDGIDDRSGFINLKFKKNEFIKTKEFEEFKCLTSEISNLNLNLLTMKDLNIFYINFYNLLFLDLYLTYHSSSNQSPSSLNILNESDFMKLFERDCYKIQGISNVEYFNLNFILKLMNKNKNEFLKFCLVDLTKYSPKLNIFKNENEIEIYSKLYLKENIIINEIKNFEDEDNSLETKFEFKLPFLFKIHFLIKNESEKLLFHQISKYLKNLLNFPNKIERIKFNSIKNKEEKQEIEEEISFKNIFNVKLNKNQFYFNSNLKYGIEINSNSLYFGEFENKKKNGKGIEFKLDGSIYEGEFKNNIIQGKGIKKENNLIIEGEFPTNSKSICKLFYRKI